MATPTSIRVVSPVQLTGLNKIDSLIIGNKWGGVTGTGINLTYSFGNTTFSQYVSRGIADTNPYNPNARYGDHDQPFEGIYRPLTIEQQIATGNILDDCNESPIIYFKLHQTVKLHQ